MITLKSVPRLGDTSVDVAILQKQLNLQPTTTVKLPTSGIFGPETLRAVQAFQQSFGSVGTGVIGPVTLQKLGLQVLAIHPLTGNETVTKDLQGKKDRHIQPSIRLQIEHYLFSNGVIPDCFNDRDLSKIVVCVQLALAKVGIVEQGGNNYGLLVGEVQGTTGTYTAGGNGDPWCLDYQQIVVGMVEDFFQIESPVPAIAHCLTCWEQAKLIPGLTTQVPTAGTICLGNHLGTSDGHAMGVVEVYSNGNMQTNEGNTSIDSMTDGDGSGLKVRNQKKNGNLVTLGFVYIYPFNKIPKVTT